MSKAVKVLLVGPCGQMGREIKSLIEADKNFSYVGGVDHKGRATFKSLKEVDARAVDVVIEFSSIKGLKETLQWCSQKKVPVVSGTTGLSKKEKLLIRSASKKTAVLWAANMSRGIAFMANLLKEFHVLKNDFDFQIEEVHHKRKKDNPSGTALYLQQEVETSSGKKMPKAVGLRGGGVFGEHSFYAFSEDEVLLIKHTALNRLVFARGAVSAAKWLAQKWKKNKKAALYQLKDTFGD